MGERSNVAGVKHGDTVLDLSSNRHGVVTDLRADADGVAGWVRVVWTDDPRYLDGHVYTRKEIQERFSTRGEGAMIQWEVKPL